MRRSISDFSFGKMLLNSLNAQQLEAVTSNSNIPVDGKSVSVFDLTEEKDSDEAIELLAKYI